MTRPKLRLGSVLFWIFFVPYVVALVLFLTAGLAPAVVKEFPSLHRALHEYGHDALRAESAVTIDFENRTDRARRITIYSSRPGRRPPVFASPLVRSHGRVAFQFVAPRAGSYRVTSPGDRGHTADIEGEIRFADDGAPSITMRIPEGQARYQRVGVGGWSEVARRVADASHRADHGARVTLELLFSALNLGFGLMLIVRRPRDRTARLLAVAMIGTAVTFNHQSHSTVYNFILGDWWDLHDLFHLLSGVAFMYAVIVFPDGRLVPLESRHRSIIRIAYGLATYFLAVNVLESKGQGHPGQPFFTLIFGLLIPVAGVAAQTYRLRRATDPVIRQQSRLLRWALLPMLIGGATYSVLIAVFGAHSVENIGLAVFPALFALVPIALMMGILRYHLWDIDVLVSRALLSIGLAVFIGSVYVVVVVVLGHGLGPGGSAGLKIVATAIVAVAFEPVRERLSRFANHLVFGDRATPYEVMAEFSDRLAGAISVDAILPRIAEASVKGVGGLASEVTVFLPSGGSKTVAWPDAGVVTASSFIMPVTYRGEQVGQIAVATAHGERLRAEEEELLAALAAQAGLAVHNARLTIELQARLDEIAAQAAELHASRQRIVVAGRVQRQRVVQLIHDRVEVRLNQALTALDELEPALRTDIERALQFIDVSSAECKEALDALRALARGIFPAILADQGIVLALDAHVLQGPLPVEVRLDVARADERYDPQAEATVYFCVVQALENAGTYAPASTVVVHLHAEDSRLTFSVSDDGPGADPRRLEAGGDIRDMRDRVEAIGGELHATAAPGEGTVIAGWVPDHALVNT